MRALITFALTGCILQNSPASSADSLVSPSPKVVSLCEVANNVDAYLDATVKFNASAVAALHGFDISLSDDRCENRAIRLLAAPRFDRDESFLRMMTWLYPGYPKDDGYTEEKVQVTVTGRVVRRSAHGLLMTCLELQSIDLHD